MRDLNTLYRGEPALHQLDCEPAGFEWVDCCDAENSVLSFLRKGKTASDHVLVVVQLHAGAAQHYHVGVPRGGRWKEILNSDAPLYGGSGRATRGRPRGADSLAWALASIERDAAAARRGDVQAASLALAAKRSRAPRER